jgi:hypothetical protein
MNMTTISAVALALAGGIAMTSVSAHAELTYQMEVPSSVTELKVAFGGTAESLFNGDGAPMSLHIVESPRLDGPRYNASVGFNPSIADGRLYVNGIPVRSQVEVEFSYDYISDPHRLTYGGASIDLWSQLQSGWVSDTTAPYAVLVSLTAQFSPVCEGFNPYNIKIFMDALQRGADMTVDGIFKPGLVRGIRPSNDDNRKSPMDISWVEVAFCVTAVHPEQ